MSEKTCSKCKTVKEFGLFTRCKKSKDGYGSWCKNCHNKKTHDKYWSNPEAMRAKDREHHHKNKDAKNEKSRKYYYANKDKYRNYHLKKCYGIKTEDYEMMRKYQQDKCAICNKELKDKLLVDHNHITEEVRGLLCNDCNCVLGYAKDNPDILNSAIDYLTDYPAQFIPIKRI